MQADISLCIIARDDKEHAVRLVKEARPWVAKIVVVDTGSVDGTGQAMLDAGADNVAFRPDFVHNDGELKSFADARNASYDMATCPWTMWLDVDCSLTRWDLLPKLIKDATKLRQTTPGLCLSMWFDVSWNENMTQCSQSIVRTFITHTNDGWFWKRPLHECLECSIPINDRIVNSIRVTHLRGSRNLINDRNLKMLRRWELECPNLEPTTRSYYLGDEMLARCKYNEAFEYFDKVGPGSSTYNVRSMYRAGISLVLAGRLQEAVKYIQALVEQQPGTVNFKWLLAFAYVKLFEHDNARQLLDEASQCRTFIIGESNEIKGTVEGWLRSVKL